MGYPMTWQRLVNRNGLADGSYTATPQRHRKNVITNGTDGSLLGEDETKLVRFDSVAARVDQYEAAARMLAGDLRRLETDIVDEQSICKQIALRTGVPDDAVATVLKEFVAL